MDAMKRWLVGLLVLASGAAAAQTTATIMPASPRYQEPVYLRITPAAGSGINIQGAQVSMDGNTLTVNCRYVIDIGQPPFDVMLGRLPTGSYTVNVVRSGSIDSTTHFSVAAQPLSDSGQPVPQVNYTDLWWNPAEPGWGMSIHQGPTNALFAIWYVYDASGNPVWYTFESGAWEIPNIYIGVINKTSGGPYFGAAFDPTRVMQAQVGTATLAFSDASHGSFIYTIDGVRSSKTIEREPIE